MASLAGPFIVEENDLINYHILQTPLGHHNRGDNHRYIKYLLPNEYLKLGLMGEIRVNKKISNWTNTFV